MPKRIPAYPPEAQGLYDAAFEKDACGVGFVVDMKGRRSHAIVDLAITALLNLEHRGATGAETNTGDGAGILIQMPDRFLREVAGFDLPEAGSYASGIAFLPRDHTAATEAILGVETIAASEGLKLIGWRDVPYDDLMLGEPARGMRTAVRQL